jgi:hypothetical protein
VCGDASVEKLDAFKERITIIPGATNDRDVIKRASPPRRRDAVIESGAPVSRSGSSLRC